MIEHIYLEYADGRLKAEYKGRTMPIDEAVRMIKPADGMELRVSMYVPYLVYDDTQQLADMIEEEVAEMAKKLKLIDHSVRPNGNENSK